MKRFTRAFLIASIGCVMLTTPLTEKVYADDNVADESVEEILEEANDIQEDSVDNSEQADENTGVLVPSPDGGNVSSIIPDDKMPLLFHKSKISFAGNAVEAAEFDNGNVTVVYYSDASGAASFKRYDESTGALSDFRMIQGPGENYIIILEPQADTEIPAGYEKAVLDWNGQSLTAFIYTGGESVTDSDAIPADYFLLYAISSTGREGFYLYDQVEGTYQRHLNLSGVAADSKDEGNGILDIKSVKDGNNDALVRLIIIIAMGVLIICLIIAVIIMGIKLKEYASYDYIDEEDYNERTGADQIHSNQQYTPSARDEQAYREKTEHIYNVMNEGESEENIRPQRETPRPRKEEHAPYRDDSARRGRSELLETSDIQDLDAILNDPEESSKYENAEPNPYVAMRRDNSENVAQSSGYPSNNMGGAQSEYPYEDDDYYGLSRKERKERKALEKQRLREEKEALKDAKYLEKERKRLEKRNQKYGYDEPTSMDWAAFGESMGSNVDDRRPMGNTQDTMPSYMQEKSQPGRQQAPDDNHAPDNSQAQNKPAEPKAEAPKANERVLSEEEKRDAAADAVIAAARGTAHIESEKIDHSDNRDGYKAYRDGAKNTYEQYRRQDEAFSRLEEEARRRGIEIARGSNQGSSQRPVKPQYTQDLDEDFEFEFLNIRNDD